MNKNLRQKQFTFRQVWHFMLHLRWHYQVFILSGGFLLGGYFSTRLDWMMFVVQFANVHLLLFGGATAYNSYFDKDEGPVGGLKNPPPMHGWMWAASVLLQVVGLVVAFRAGIAFSLIYLLSMLLFWFYSSPHFRWKGTPWRSLIAIGVSTGTNSLLLGYLAAGNELIPGEVWVASLGVASVILSLYPASQLYQLDEDHKRGDVTYAAKYGYHGVIRFFQAAFSTGIILLGVALAQERLWIGFSFFIAGAAIGFIVYRRIKNLTSESDDYSKVMSIKYMASIAFVSFIVLLLFVKHGI